MRYHATHITTYRYEAAVAQCLTEARLTPRTFTGQDVAYVNIDVNPPPVMLERRRDYFGNEVVTFSVFQAHDRYTVKAESVVDVKPPADETLPTVTWEDAKRILAGHPDEASLEAFEFTFPSPFVPLFAALTAYGQEAFVPAKPLTEVVADLCHRIHTEFSYKPASTSIDMPLADVLRRRQGVCQDFAHIMIGVLRSFGLAARYVSGYLRSGADYEGSEASHAWVSVFIPGYGWMDIDPTNDVRPSGGHVTLAWGRDYGDVAPVKGISLGGGGQTVAVEVRVVPMEGPEREAKTADEVR